MDQVLRGLPFAYDYIDDILVTSATEEEHLEHLREVCCCLDANGIVINPKKCVLGVTSLEFLGHQVDRQGIRPLEEKVNVICQFPQPTSQRKLRQFLGLVNFYHRFIPGCAHILQPLHLLLTGSTKSERTLVWTPTAEAAFKEVKDALSNAILLVHPQSDAPTCIVTDASDITVGAVLQQCIDSVWSPLSYFSRKLTPAETRYSTFDHELLAVYLAIKHFWHSVSSIDFAAMARAQQDDPDLTNAADSSSLQLRAIPLLTADTTMLCDMSTGTPHPYVPQPLHMLFLTPCIPCLIQAFVPHNV